MLERVQDIVIHDLNFSDTYDFLPACGPKDNGHGEWNSKYDGDSLGGGVHWRLFSEHGRRELPAGIGADRLTRRRGDAPRLSENPRLGTSARKNQNDG